MNNQRVPSSDVDEIHISSRLNTTRPHQSNSSKVDVPMSDYEVAELTWKNGQPAMHGLGLCRVPDKSMWEKLSAGNGGTLESLVNQATTLHHNKAVLDGCGGGGKGASDELVPWYLVPPPSASTASDTMTIAAALVPCTNNTATKISQGHSKYVFESVPVFSSLMGGCSTRVESCSGVPDTNTNLTLDHSVSNSATWGRDSYQVTFDTCEKELCTAGFTSTSMGSPENTSSAKQWNKNGGDDHDSVCHTRTEVEACDEEDKKKEKCSNSNKRGRAAAIHNQSERKRRDKINQRMKTLQKLIPNSSKTDKASMLDEVIEYLKQLQAQIQMMKGMNMSSMMFPMAMQQQLQMSMMAPMGMGMPGMGMPGMGVMDMNTLAGRTNMPVMPPAFHPNAYMPMASWDGNGDRLPATISAMPDPMSAYFACQSQPMTMDAYTRMASLYQQFQQQPPGPSSKP